MPLLRLLRTSTFRLALLYAALFTGSVVALLAFIYWQTAGYMARQIDATIDTTILSLAEQYRQGGVSALIDAVNERAALDRAGIYLLAAPDFHPLAGNLRNWPDAARNGGWISLPPFGQSPARNIEEARARHFVLDGTLHLLIGRDTGDLHRTQTVIAEAILWGLAAAIGLAILGGVLMSLGTMRRIEAINRTSAEIMQGDLARRIPTRGTGDDFDQLGANLNAMLDRIEQLMTGIRQVSDNIAHDLKSPLTRLRTSLELIRAGTPEIDPAHAPIEEAIDEADNLLATFNALLRIAEIEAGSRRAGFADVALDDLARDACELFEPVAQDRRRSLSAAIEPVAPYRGDRQLLSQALGNLIENAIKYTPEGGHIDLQLREGSGGPEFIVADDGPGIPEAFRHKVLQRFFRLESSRSSPGNGLGLSLVAAVAQLHGGEIHLEDNHPGLRAVLTLGRDDGIAASHSS